MRSYVESVLAKDEKVIHYGKVSIWSIAPLILFGFIFLVFNGIGVIFWIVAAIRYFTTELAITNRRVIAKFGLIGRETIEVSIQRIESIQIHQGIMGRILNFGSIILSGAGNPQVPIPCIHDPLKFRRVFVDTQEGNDTNQGEGNV